MLQAVSFPRLLSAAQKWIVCLWRREADRGLAAFVIGRLVALAVLLAIVSFLVFSLLYVAPGNPVSILLGTNPRTPATVRALKHEYHLDQPFLTQFWIWVRGAVHLDFGRSIQTTLPVTTEIRERIVVSLFLGVYAFILTMISGVGFGIVAAFRRRRLSDRLIVGTAIVGLSTPAFVSGVFLLYLLAIRVSWFPTFGSGTWFWDEAWHLTLPAVALAATASAYVLKHTRAAMAGVLEQDYITFARARGLPSRRILFVYALRNALIPVTTISGVILAYLITGAVLVETTFSIPGIGALLVQSATTRDLPVIQGVAMTVAVVIVLANFLTDLVYIAIDPRVRLGRRSR